MILSEYLKQHEKYIYMPNPGNCGDSVIAYSTLLYLDNNGINYTMYKNNEVYNNEILLFGGGGNLTLYDNCKKFIIKNQSNNKIIILPHTVFRNEELLRNLNDNVTIICRELKSYNHVLDNIPNKNNVLLSHDMALYLTMYYNFDTFFIEEKNMYDIGYCFRIDCEKTNIEIPKNNNDISNTLKTRHKNSFDDMKYNTESFLKYINKYKTIVTNRLHVAICAVMLKKKVIFHNNSYHKNKSVYEYSLKYYNNIEFIDDQNT